MADDSDDQHEPLPRFEIEDADVGRGLTKVGGTLAAHLAKVGEDERLTAIVKVAEPGYVPQGVRQRAAIGPDNLYRHPHPPGAGSARPRPPSRIH